MIALQPRSNRECEPQGGEQHEADNLPEAGGAAPNSVQVRLDDHRADESLRRYIGLDTTRLRREM